MKRITGRGVAFKGSILTGLLLLGSAPAQPEQAVYLESGVFTPDQVVRLRVYAPGGAVFTLRRVLQPTDLFLKTKDPHQPVLAANSPTQVVKTVRWTGAREQPLEFGKLPSGVYLLGTGKLSTVVLVSDLGLAVKRDANSALTYTAALLSGQAREAQVWALGLGGPKQSAGGLAKFSIPSSGNNREEQVFLARSGNDWAVSGGYWSSYYDAQKVRGYVYTDRPVYRPGQHADFKGVLRETKGLRALAGQDVTVTVTSPDNEQVYRQTLKTNAYGSLSGGFDLSESGRVGTYRFQVRPVGMQNSDIYSEFQVEAYQKPEYEVTIQPEQPKAVQGDQVKVKVAARYLFGGAVSGARVQYRVVRQPTYWAWWMEDMGDRIYAPQSEKLIKQEDTRLNETGDLEILLPLERDKSGQAVTYRVEAEVEDEARRPFSAQTTLTAYPSSLTVQADVNGWVFDAGEPIQVKLSTRTLQDKGQAAPVLLELIRDGWQYVGHRWTHETDTVISKQVTTKADGTLSTTLTAPRGGGYRLRATVKDAQGRKASSETFMWVFREGESWNWYSRELGVRFDQESYRTGDTATVLITNPNPGVDVLLTVEGDKLRQSVVLEGKSTVMRYQFKVTGDMAPNIHVGAASFGGGQFYEGLQSVKVTHPDAELSVNVQADKAKYQPGDQGTFTVNVKDATGKGVASELAFSVVDQAIYLIRPDDNPSMLDVFQAPRQNTVSTQSSRQFYFAGAGSYGWRGGGPVSATTADMAVPAPAAESVMNKAAAPGEASQSVTPRVDFRDTLLWIPNLVTDASGKAVVEVKFPDNLTTWVSTARAHTVTPRWGQTTSNTLVTKDVVARLSLPVFLVRGDQVTLSGIVNNTLDKPLTGNASLNLDGLNALSGAALKFGGTPLNIPALGRQRFDVQVGAKTLGSAQVTFTARTPLGNDALRLPVPVKARGYDMTVTSVGSGGTTLNLTLPADTAPESTKLRLDLTPSLLSAVAPALEYLIGYPYGCTEQTMSRFLPALLTRQSLGDTGLPSGIRKDLDKYVDIGLARLMKFQHDDGGWNFWEHDDSTLEMTAYVVEGLLRAKATGTKVNNRMLDRGLTYLTNHVDDKDTTQAERARTYRVLAMTDRVKSSDLLAFSKNQKLQPYALAQLSLALHDAGETQAAASTLQRLKVARKSSQGSSLVYWEKPDRASNWYWYWDDNQIQVTAAALEAIATLEPGSDLIPRTSQWLLLQRRGQRWLSTQDTTSVIIAALKIKPASTTNATLNVLLDGKHVGTVKLEGRNAATLNLTQPLEAGRHTLDLKGAPQGLVASAQIKFSREPQALGGITDQGITLTRSYERLTPHWDKANRRYEYTRSNLLQNGKLQTLIVGDLVKVTLRIQTKNNARYLLVSDPIPAGMKALDDRSLVYAGEASRNNWWDWWYWYSGRDLLDDRVDLYASYLSGHDTQTMTYILRAQTPGTFTALPSHAFLMYDPDVEGYGPAATFNVIDRQD